MQDNRSAVGTKSTARGVTLAMSVAAVAVVGLSTLGTAANASATSAGASAAVKARPAAASATVTTETAKASTYWTAARLASAKSADVVSVTKAQAAAMAKEATPARGTAGRVAGTAAPSVGSKAVRPMNFSGAVNWWGSLSAMPATTTGRVFFSKYTAGGAFAGNFSCSGSIVNSEGKDMVFTAGHCVHGGAGYAYHRNWIFIPGYRNGTRPEGTWYAKRLQTLNGWAGSSDFRYDMGVGLVSPDAIGRQITNRFGGQGIAWNYSSAFNTYDFGYPADPPFNGTTLKVCQGDTFLDGYMSNATIGIYCNMTGGASGGPWLRWFNGTTGWVNGVNSYKYGSLPGNIYSSYFGNGAMNLYNANRYL